MSGGHFEYNCFRISQFADDLKHEIEINDDKTMNEIGGRRGYNFSAATLRRVITAHLVIEKAGKIAKEIEWLYSGDHGEESFNILADKILEDFS